MVGDGGRGDAVFDMIRNSDEPLFITDVATVASRWEDADKTYKTLLAAPIRTAEVGYGMLTIDSPEAGSISQHDRGIVRVLGTLLAIAMAERDRR